VEGNGHKFEQISDIFSRFSEENKDALIETAKDLLKRQDEDGEIVMADSVSSQNELDCRKFI